MKKFMWVVDRVERLSSFLRVQLPEYDKQSVINSIRYHGCRVNSRIERFESYKVHPGDHINLVIRTPQKPQILWDHPQWCAYDKPAYLSTEELAAKLKLSIVHRLDRDTTGCILFAKHEDSVFPLTQLFKKRKIIKQYIALVFGHPNKSSGTITSYTAPKARRCGAVIFGNTHASQGKLTITQWSILCTYKKYSLIQCSPITGRTHQIRLHMRTLGHPIVGDIDYGSHNQPPNIFRPLLHAHSIKFPSPFSNENIHLIASSSGDPRKEAAHLLES
ncbi:RluA family pseudouridine synthase [Chlamydia avium]|uniref:RNA pseudouridylate synthase family protein n=1 Tax=Chlamydia avium TaxID=1457141 RepID=A0ABP2X640_9CHLA|nr:RluA family pseudouridine synthase [Chlamydia avium]EPP38274.1 RNA pseudouridylate synthase family protein [Chlamydia avium]